MRHASLPALSGDMRALDMQVATARSPPGALLGLLLHTHTVQ